MPTDFPSNPNNPGRQDAGSAPRFRGGRRASGVASGGGFSLIELLVVVVILGILASIVLVSVSKALASPDVVVASANAQTIHKAAQLYQADHGVYPDADRIADQLTLASNANGETAEVGTEGYELGPYLAEIPDNPFTGGNTIGSAAGADYVYDADSGGVALFDRAATGDARANLRVLLDAALAYQSDHDALPGSLQQLADGYLTPTQMGKVLVSPRTGEPFAYRNVSPASNPNTTLLITETLGGKPATGMYGGYLGGQITELP